MRTIKKSELMQKLGEFLSVNNTTARCGHGTAPNQFELRFENGRVFQSYQTIIAVYYNHEWYFSDSHDCSNTTSRHVGNYCGFNAKERRNGLSNGTFINIVD